jgi:hypothetical protein
MTVERPYEVYGNGLWALTVGLLVLIGLHYMEPYVEPSPPQNTNAVMYSCLEDKAMERWADQPDPLEEMWLECKSEMEP